MQNITIVSRIVILAVASIAVGYAVGELADLISQATPLIGS